ncbi:MAG TPA: hypothetical protein VMC09_17995 [Anaerolineales bacterium]|nr:hypothetical protein [Anaerolineales bacterium]
MDEKLVEIREYIGPGYQPVIDFGDWRVAILNYLDEVHPENIRSMERHNETDEVFVLERGRAVLFIGEGESQIEKIHPQVMVPGKMYNIKRGVWHTVALTRDASILLVENRNTARENSNYVDLTAADRKFIQETVRREQPGCWPD